MSDELIEKETAEAREMVELLKTLPKHKKANLYEGIRIAVVLDDTGDSEKAG